MGQPADFCTKCGDTRHIVLVRAAAPRLSYDLIMASLTAKKINGRTYYYLRECQRVDGKPKIVWQQYLGSAEAVAAALGKAPSALVPLSESPTFSFGAEAALLDLARELEIAKTIDRHVPRRSSRGPRQNPRMTPPYPLFAFQALLLATQVWQ